MIQSTPVWSNGESQDDCMFSMMTCTYIYSYTALTAFASGYLYRFWHKKDRILRKKYRKHTDFESLMRHEFRDLKEALKELAVQFNVPQLHEEKPEAWRNLNELIKMHRDYFVHPEPERFSEHVCEAGLQQWGFASKTATEIIEYYYTKSGHEVPAWLSRPGLRCKRFEVVSI